MTPPVSRASTRAFSCSHTLLVLALFLAFPPLAQPQDLAAGEAMFANCAYCHGAQGQGNEQADAPKLGGRQAEYLTRQLQNFRDGLRGYLPEDIPGRQMALMSRMLEDDAAIRNVIAYIQSLPDTAAPAMGSGPGRPYRWESTYAEMAAGDAGQGQGMYAICGSCHGLQGEGLEALGAPRLHGREPWYLTRQLKYFRDGIRGAHARDLQGQSMAIMVRTLGGEDQVIYDLVAYIDSL